MRFVLVRRCVLRALRPQSAVFFGWTEALGCTLVGTRYTKPGQGSHTESASGTRSLCSGVDSEGPQKVHHTSLQMASLRKTHLPLMLFVSTDSLSEQARLNTSAPGLLSGSTAK